MLHRNWLFMSAAGLAAFTACSSEEGTPGAGGSAGSAGGSVGGAAGAAGTAQQGDASQVPGTDAGDAAAGDAEAGIATAFVRVANLSPDVAAIDICVRPRSIVADAGAEAATDSAADSASDANDGSSAEASADASDGSGPAGFAGPLLKAAGIPTGLAYSQVTAYLPIAPGAYDVRVVAPNGDCATPIPGTLDSLGVVTATSTSYSTLAAIGLTTPQTVPAFQVKAYADEHTVAAGQAKLRVINASPGTPNIDIGLGTGEGFVLLIGNVAYPGVGASTLDAGVGIDASGYLQGPPVTSQTLVARLTGDPTDVLLVSGFTMPAGTITTTFAIGVVASVTTPLKLLICQDLDTSKAPLANCSVKP